ncbi:hypothetical protein HAX54_018991 [Datura stramonium]|uniref:Uncharacterized protein n=1 Tax=Datura stramonium TaxID=4076 RepID=A0ABS8UQI5_DATST|nr:hypothetical protein [Datura stramonium]
MDLSAILGKGYGDDDDCSKLYSGKYTSEEDLNCVVIQPPIFSLPQYQQPACSSSMQLVQEISRLFLIQPLQTSSVKFDTVPFKKLLKSRSSTRSGLNSSVPQPVFQRFSHLRTCRLAKQETTRVIVTVK